MKVNLGKRLNYRMYLVCIYILSLVPKRMLQLTPARWERNFDYCVCFSHSYSYSVPLVSYIHHIVIITDLNFSYFNLKTLYVWEFSDCSPRGLLKVLLPLPWLIITFNGWPSNLFMTAVDLFNCTTTVDVERNSISLYLVWI